MGQRTRLVPFACFVSLALVALSCGAGASSRAPACGTPALTSPCACDGRPTGRQMRDACTSAAIGECLCPQPMACTQGDGQAGTKICFGGDCGACASSPGSTTRVWTTPGLGSAKEIAVAPDGALFVLINGAPWIRKFDAAGAPQPFVPHGSFELARHLGIDGDGTLVVTGTETAPSVEGGSTWVVVQRLDATGVLVTSVRWGFGEPGPMVRKGSDLILSARLSSAATLARLTADNQLVELASLVIPFASTPESIAPGPNDSFLVAGISRDNRFAIVGNWLAILDTKGGPHQLRQTSSMDVRSSMPRLVANAAGEIYASWNHKDMGSVFRLDEALRTGWTADLGLNMGISAIVALPDGVLALGPSARRFDRLGREVPQEAFTDRSVGSLASVGPRDIVTITCLSSVECDLSRFTFGDLPAAFAPQAAGKSCVAGVDCQSGRCCVAVPQATGTCSATPTCAVGSRCARAADCADGACAVQEAQREGLCVKRCTATGQCAVDETCGGIGCPGPSCALACIKGCSTPQICDALAVKLTCQPTVNAENVTVNACR